MNEEPMPEAKTTTTMSVTTTTSGKRFVLKRRLQNGSLSSPSNGNGNGDSSNGGNTIIPQLVATGTNSTPGTATHLGPRGPSGSLKIRKIEP